MPVYRYSRSIPVENETEVSLSAEFPDYGSAAHHIIDLPGPDNDFERLDQFSEFLGYGADLKPERTIVFSKCVNLDPDNPFVRINYFLNGILLVEHSNPKNDDQSPQIKVTLTFY